MATHPSPEPTPQRPDVRLLLLPLPEFTLLPFGGFLDKLRFSADDADRSRQRHCAWTLLGIDAQPVTSSSGVRVEIDATPTDVDWRAFDYLVVFGSRTVEKSMALASAYAPVLRAANRHGLPLVAIDNASFLLARAGLLRGHEVALHWQTMGMGRHLPAFFVERARWPWEGSGGDRSTRLLERVDWAAARFSAGVVTGDFDGNGWLDA
ncbi:MAG: AraC family transcriptional regulator, partial [Burkholderiaceae bacterium]|nr:AraC family transcriptional regulator [Burkholderiaceae bacterium]